MKKIEKIKLIVFSLFVAVNIMLLYLYINNQAKDDIWMVLSIFELGIISILIFIIIKLINMIEQKIEGRGL
ncbi:hypothetical protein CCP3SC5AM1_2460002 [Gammaproteobacteria bacterium]